jgi:hypothetical protein
MKVEFSRKSNSKRRAIFKQRAQRIVENLLLSMEATTGKRKSPEERKAITTELVEALHRGMTDSLDDILSEEIVEPLSHDELIDSLVSRLKS